MAVAARPSIGALSRRFPSPLRYPGGKGKVANYIKLTLIENDLVGAEYVEPYAGGASVALSLLFEEFVSRVFINDIDVGVYSFWRVVLSMTEELCEKVSRTPVTMAQWHRQREIYDQGTNGGIDQLDIAFATFFLNRTNRSGIIRGGVIGGQRQTGKWKLDARYNTDELIRRIRKIARYKTRIVVSNVDAKLFLAPWIEEDRSAFVYLDPPYYMKGSGLYTNFYRHEDHVEIAQLAMQLKSPWIVSYDSVGEIMDLYPGLELVDYSLSYSAAGRYKGREVMFFSRLLVAPTPDSPANIPMAAVDRAKLAALGW